jgi:hypothetical protein
MTQIAYQSAHAKFAEDFEQRAGHIKEHIDKNKITAVQKRDEKLVEASYDIVKDLPQTVANLRKLRSGDPVKAGVDISLGEYAQKKYGIPTDEFGRSDNFLRLIGVEPNNHTLSQLANQNSSASFTASAELNNNYTWLVGETILEALRTGLLQRGIYKRLIMSDEMHPYDNIRVPIIKRPNGFFKEVQEGATVEAGTLEFDEIQLETKDIATKFRLTDKVVRNVRLNLLLEYMMGAAGDNLDRQLTREAIKCLLSGNTNGGNDAAPVVGVLSTGTVTYDDDWLYVVLNMSTNGYYANSIVGDIPMIMQALSLPEFKGFNGTNVVARVNTDVPLPSDYAFFPTGAMPASTTGGGQLLFIDPTRAMKHIRTKPLTLESDRIIEQLSAVHVISMTSRFVKQNVDASTVLDSTVNRSTNPYPALYSSATLDGIGY